jgi:hypothetical protein
MGRGEGRHERGGAADVDDLADAADLPALGADLPAAVLR